MAGTYNRGNRGKPPLSTPATVGNA